MSEIYNIIQEINLENGSKYKKQVLSTHKDNELLKRVLQLTYDKVKYSFGIGKTSLAKIQYNTSPVSVITLDDALDVLENQLATREITGNRALEAVHDTLENLSDKDAFIIRKVIERDLRINLGKTHINSVFKGLIKKPVYSRCGVYSKKTSKDINWPAFIQVKSDGTYREFSVTEGLVECQSRSGEKYDYPLINEKMKHYPDGVFTGELTVNGISDRSEANGLINSDNPPHEDIKLEVWDFISHEEYSLAGQKLKPKVLKERSIKFTEYHERLHNLETIVGTGDARIRVIESHLVGTLAEAIKFTVDWMKAGKEGGVLKDAGYIFKDGTSPRQLKLKIEADIEVRCVGFKDGTIGTKREGRVGSILFANDEDTIQGATSGFSDKVMNMLTDNPDKYLNKVFEIKFNDITKGRNNDFYALSHPRYVEFRDDKDTTDTLVEAREAMKSAMEVENFIK